MINVDRIYQRVLTLANKEQRGYITPQEFNLLANHAQMDIFEQYFYDLSQFLKTPGNSTVHADTVDILEEKISVFEASANLVVTGNAALLTDAPAFYRLSSVIEPESNTIFESVTRKEITLFQNSPIAAPTNTRPVYTLDLPNSRINLFGREPQEIQVNYIRSPRRVNWTYVVVGDKALYNATASDLQHFTLHPSEETDLVLKILTLAGFTLKDPGLYQAAANEDAKNIQQEKQ